MSAGEEPEFELEEAEATLADMYPDDVVIRIPGHSLNKVEISIGPNSRLSSCLRGTSFSRLELIIDPEDNSKTHFIVSGIAEDGSEITMAMQRGPDPQAVEDAAVEAVKEELGLEKTPRRAPMQCK